MTSVSVVMPAYNEEDAVGGVVESFLAFNEVDEVIVADNNSTDQTVAVAKTAGAQVVHEEQQGYGYAVKRALSAASGDIIVTVESDQSFDPKDMFKLLQYADDVEVVFGDRTNTSLIDGGAKMGRVLRFGNKFLGRMIQLLFNGPRITDVGCSYRLFHREALDTLLAADVRGGHTYSPQLLIEALKSDLDIVVVPVNYRERVGESKLTKTIQSSVLIGLQMAVYILNDGLRYRVGRHAT